MRVQIYIKMAHYKTFFKCLYCLLIISPTRQIDSSIHYVRLYREAYHTKKKGLFLAMASKL